MPTSNTIFDYLSTLLAEDLDQLYTNGWVCMGVMRALHPIVQQLVLRTLLSEDLLIEKALQYTDEDYRAGNEDLFALSKKNHKDEMTRAENLRVFVSGNDSRQRLNTIFRTALLGAYSATGELKAPKRRKLMSVQDLGEYGWKKWESVLLFMVGATPLFEIPESMKTLLNDTGMVQQLMIRQRESKRASSTRADDEARITREGFQFLLMDVYAQIWRAVEQYIKNPPEGMNPLEVIAFLFQLSFSKLGEGQPKAALTQSQMAAVDDLVHFGLTYIPSDPELHKRYYYPTPLGMHLTSCSPDRPQFHSTAQVDIASGYIVVETNNRLYAYTTSTLEIKLLELFVEIRYKLPNLVVGVITRESITRALRCGITSAQILGYLHQRAHPEMRKRSADRVLPETVVDQVQMWESERNRLEVTSGVLHRCTARDEYDKLKETLRARGTLNFFIDDRLMLVSTIA